MPQDPVAFVFGTTWIGGVHGLVDGELLLVSTRSNYGLALESPLVYRTHGRVVTGALWRQCDVD